ncbi:MAG: hypothetical protein K6U89_03645 [Chloroflexi bacterium]|nr:hypothetical protein [Chloroflexota bacterium]
MGGAVDDQGRPRRPRAVTWVALLHFGQGLLVLPLWVLIWLAGALEAQRGELFSPGGRELLLYGVLLSALDLLLFPIAYGLLRLRPWAWTLAMVLQGVLLATALVQSYFGEDDYLTLAVGVFVVLCLNQREVRAAFAVGGQGESSR